MKTSDFNYVLPKELIAQHPLEKRDLWRLMVLNRKSRTIENKTFKDIIDYLEPGDCLVINDTKVIPARLYGKRIATTEGSKDVEILLLKEIDIVKPKVIITFGNQVSSIVIGKKIKVSEIKDFIMNKIKF